MTRLAVSQRMTYAEYISSPAWRHIRCDRLEKDGHRCQGCGTTIDFHVHHRTYERFGHELLEDLITVCVTCHGFIHQEHARKNLPLSTVTDRTIAIIRAPGDPQRPARKRVRHIPRHVREPTDWRRDSRGGGTWAKGVPKRNKAASRRRANGL